MCTKASTCIGVLLEDKVSYTFFVWQVYKVCMLNNLSNRYFIIPWLNINTIYN